MESSRYLGRTARRRRCTSSARTCSARARTRSAAPTTGSRALTDEERARGVVAASAGNHAQGVALAARELGIARDDLHARRRRPAQARRPPATTAPRSCCAGDSVGEPLQAAAEFAARDRRRAHPAVRPPRRHRRPGHARPRDPRAGARRRRRSSCRSAAAASPPASRARSSSAAAESAARCGSSACRPRTPRPTPPSLAAGAPVAGTGRADDRRRHRRVPPGRAQLRDHPRRGRRGRHGDARTTSRARCSCCSSGRSSSSSRPARSRVAALMTGAVQSRRPGRRGALGRQHRPAAACSG